MIGNDTTLTETAARYPERIDSPRRSSLAVPEKFPLFVIKTQRSFLPAHE